MTGLAQLLRVSTKEVHGKAEGTKLMKALVRGEMTLPDYRVLLMNLQGVYNALEDALESNRANATVSPLMLDGLARSSAIARDLEDLDHVGGEPVVLALATSAYVDRLRFVGEQSPVLLAAHSYVRYLGDLYGGQMLAPVVARRIGAPTSFYDFGDPQKVAALTKSYRQALDRLPLNERDTAAVVDEATSAFERHIDLFRELAG